jgi:hypothetical protein
MSASDRRRLVIVAALILGANFLDLASTYLASPDLADEWNVLERFFGLGWAGLVCAKLIGGWFAIVGYGYYLRHRTTCYPPAGADGQSFLRFFAFGRPVAWLDGHYQSPKLMNLGVKLGYFWAGLQALILWVALDNLLLSYGIVMPFRRVSELGYHLAQSWIVALMVLARFYKGNYRRYLGLTEPRIEEIAIPAIG